VRTSWSTLLLSFASSISRCLLSVEQVGPHGLEDETVTVGVASFVAVVDQPEQQVQRLVQMMAFGGSSGERDLDDLAQAVESVTGAIFRRTYGKDAEFGPGFGK
jgi:hypothetical protein